MPVSRMTDALDGNAIAGLLREVFQVEMTTATGICAHCGAKSRVAELAVYVRAPGTVARCRTCLSVLMVLVTVRGITCVDLRGLEEMQPPSGTGRPEAAS
jgi:Family of unknown function (DUF6510)